MLDKAKRRLSAARPKSEMPTRQSGHSARAARRQPSGPLAVLVGGAMLFSSLAMIPAVNIADAQGLEAGAGLRQARERNRRIDARQRKAMENLARSQALSRRLGQRTNEQRNVGESAKSRSRRFR